MVREVCTLYGMGIEDAIRMGDTLEMSRTTREEICFVRNPVAKENMFSLDVMFSLVPPQI